MSFRSAKKVMLALVMIVATAAFSSPESATAAYEAEVGVSVASQPLVGILAVNWLGCDTCKQTCSSGKHKLVDTEAGPDRSYDEPEHGCKDGWCSVAHPSENCTIQQFAVEERERFWNQVVSGSEDGLAEYVAEFGDLATVNVARQALQIADCSGEILLNIPLTQAQLNALAP